MCPIQTLALLPFLIVLANFQNNEYETAAPQWLTSQYFRAGNQNVINVLTGSDKTPEYVFVFSSPLPDIPKLAYGVKNYRGNDYFGQERFEVRRVDLTAATFRVAVQIYGVTNIHILNVPYIAIDPTFPHHLNSFDNVPINYNNGDLTNITDKSTSLQTYINIVNYTQQAAGMVYTKFKQPLSNNRILLYIMALDIFSTFQSGSSRYPIDFHVSATVLTSETYQFKATLQVKVQITLLHFSMIMFDQADVESSRKYYIITQYYDLPQEGGFIPLPEEFMDNFILGLTDFSTDYGKSSLNYNWEFTIIDGIFGVLVEQSVPIVPQMDRPSFVRQGTMVFYMKTWMCPQGFDFFNLTTNLCQDMCGDYTFENNNNYLCEYCNYSCLDCTSGHDCLACSGNLDNRVLTGDKACTCLPGYYQVGDNNICQSCEELIPNCVDCFFNDTYNENDTESGAVEIGCFQCIPQKFLRNNLCEDYLQCQGATVLNVETNTCEDCPLEGCIDCVSMTECAECDALQQKFLNPTTKKCESCFVSFCQECSGLDTCSACKQSFILLYNYCICPEYHYLDIDDSSCKTCSPYCKTCLGQTPYDCLSCYYDQHRILIGGACICDEYNYDEPDAGQDDLECKKMDLTKCDRGFVYIAQSNQCVQLCGDGMVVEMECDDGNIKNGDGCSDKCEIEDFYVCSNEKGEISVCKLQAIIQIEEIVVAKDAQKNSLEFVIDISPKTDAYSNYDLASILEFTGADIQIIDAVYEDGKLIIKTNYVEDLVDKQISLKIKQDSYYPPDSPPYPYSVFTTPLAPFQLGSPTSSLTIKVSKSGQTFSFTTSNNLDPYFYSTEQYEAYETSRGLIIGTTVTGITAAGITFFLKSSLPTIFIVSSLQMCYLGLSTVDGLNPVSQAIKESKYLIGYNEVDVDKNPQAISEPGPKTVSSRIQAMGFSENLSTNLNIMLFCSVAMLALTLFFYMASMKKPAMKVAHKIMQKETLVFIFFNVTNVFFSLSLLNTLTISNLAIGGVASLVIGYQFIHFLAKTQEYYGMDHIFNLEKKHYKIFLVVYLLNKMGACIFLTHIQDPENGSIGSIVTQGTIIIFLLVLRPFIHLLTNILIAAGEILTCGFYASIYAMEGLKSNEWLNGWIMVGIMGGVALVGVVNIAHSIYLDCKFYPKKEAKIFISPDSY